mgnify:CR=1 FL=1
MKILKFKTISPFFELCRDGGKPFDIRLIDHKDKRFRALSQIRFKENPGWAIKFTNPTTGENFARLLLKWDYLRSWTGYVIEPNWAIVYLGELVKE